jgi:hypothetical protein
MNSPSVSSSFVGREEGNAPMAITGEDRELVYGQTSGCRVKPGMTAKKRPHCFKGGWVGKVHPGILDVKINS